MKDFLTRRKLLTGGAITLGGLALTGCDALSASPGFRSFLSAGESLTMSAQRALMFGQPLAREFSAWGPIRAVAPQDLVNVASEAHHVADVVINATSYGMADRPLDLSLADLRALPARTQITRHDCVEGWSAIGKWQGAQLGPLLQTAGLKPNARFAVMHCADNYGGGADMYYESIDLIDGFHPQTILTYNLNGQQLDVAHGAPLRLRVERQLGYKHAKYLMRIELVERLDAFGRGKGGYWEDRGYEWYAGI